MLTHIPTHPLSSKYLTCIYGHINMHAHARTHTHARMHAHTSAHTHACTHARTRTRARTHTHTYTHTHVFMHAGPHSGKEAGREAGRQAVRLTGRQHSRRAYDGAGCCVLPQAARLGHQAGCWLAAVAVAVTGGPTTAVRPPVQGSRRVASSGGDN